MKTKKIIFIASSGRSGTLSLANLISQKNNIEIYHEYLFDVILYNAVKYKMKLISKKAILEVIENTYGLSVFHSDKEIWVDCSNAIPWIIKPLFEIFPNSKFIHLIRDGRKVTSSFYNKFKDIMYSDHAVNCMINWLENRKKYKEPPPDKKYWRPIPLNNTKDLYNFKILNQFERICYYWNEINLQIENDFKLIPNKQRLTIKFEDLLTSKDQRHQFSEFCSFNLNNNDYQFLNRPINIHIKKNFPLNNSQLHSFKKLCWDTMKKYNYNNSKEYNVKY